jgi:hypothetical protein
MWDLDIHYFVLVVNASLPKSGEPGQPGLKTKHERQSLVAIPIFAITATALTGGKDRVLSISIATSVSPPT